MKLFTALVAISILGCSVNAVSDFTSTATSSLMYIDPQYVLSSLDMTYPDLVQSISYSFDYLTQTSGIPADVVDYVVNVQKSYKPWYTAIQDNINNAKANVVQSIKQQIQDYKGIADEIEIAYNEASAVFASRGCDAYLRDQYFYDYQSKLQMVSSSVTSSLSMISTNVQNNIPSMLISGFSSALSSAIYQSGATVDAIKAVENTLMDQTARTYANAVSSTTDYLIGLYEVTFTSNKERLQGILAAMVNGAQTAQCTGPQ